MGATKSVKFIDLSRRNWMLIFLVTGVVCILGVLLSHLFIDWDPVWRNRLMVVGQLSLMIFFVRPFLYKHSVDYNEKGMNIRINSFWGKNIVFDQVKVLDLQLKKMIIHDDHGVYREIDTTGIRSQDTDQLIHLILTYSEAKIKESSMS